MLFHCKPLKTITDWKIVKPWGKISKIREDLEASSKTEKEGGSGIGAKFWDWSEEQVRAFEGTKP